MQAQDLFQLVSADRTVLLTRDNDGEKISQTGFVYCPQGAPGPVGPLGPAGPSGEKVCFLF